MFFRYSSNSARSCCASTAFLVPSFKSTDVSSKNSLVFSFIAFSSLCVRDGRERYTPSLVHWYVQCPYWKHFWQYGSAFSIQSVFRQVKQFAFLFFSSFFFFQMCDERDRMKRCAELFDNQRYTRLSITEPRSHLRAHTFPQISIHLC